MTTALPLVFGALAGLGLFITVAGWQGGLGEGGLGEGGLGEGAAAPLAERVRERLSRVEMLNVRIFLAVIGAAFMTLLTGWVVGALMAALGGAAAPTLLQARSRREVVIARTEALATWAEQLRDTIAAASGLREAIAATAAVAAPSIAGPVRELEIRLRSERFDTAVRRFATVVDDPIADKIAVALLIASERRGQRLTDVLSEVARAAREQAEMQMRMEAARARIYTQAVTVTTVLIGMFVIMIVFSRDYLVAYDSLTGQLVLLAVLAGWSAAFAGLIELSKVRQPERVVNPQAPEANSLGRNSGAPAFDVDELGGERDFALGNGGRAGQGLGDPS